MIFGKHVNKFYLKYFLYFLLGVIALIVVDYFQLLLPEILGDLTDLAVDGSITGDILLHNVLFIVLIGAVMFGGRFLWRITIFGESIKIQSDLREDMFTHAEKLSQRYYQENKTGGIMALFTNDLETIEESFGIGVIMLVDALFLGGLSFYKMLKINWILALVATIPLLLLAACGGIIGKYMSLKFEQRQKAFENMSDYTQENFYGIRVIKSFVKEAKELLAFKKINQDNKDKNIAFVKYAMLLDSVISLLIYSVIVIIIAGGGYYVYLTSMGQEGVNFTVGQVTEFIGYFDTLVWPMMALAQIINLRSRAKASLKRVSTFLDQKVEIVDGPIVKDKLNGDIVFNHFSFAYPGTDKDVLKDINVHIKSGELIGVVGKIGSGKSTFVNVLLRLYNVEKETIFIDGTDIMDLSIQSVRENIGYVPQDSFLFSDSVRNNIAFYNRNVNQELIDEAAEFSVVKDNILEFSKQYDTITGERGVSLSGGQKQRISIARAFIKRPPILILDDSVSAVDLQTEETILDNIRNKRKGLTTILVASRVSTVQHLDRILVFEDGKVEAFGTHLELMKESKVYRHMVELQQLEQELKEEQ